VQAGEQLAADLNIGLSGLAQTGAALANSFGAGPSSLAGSLGIDVPGPTGGFSAGLTGLNTQLNAALSGSLNGGLPGIPGFPGLPGLLLNVTAPIQALLTAGAPTVFGLQQMQTGFNTGLVSNEFGLNQSLVANEMALEQSIFGTNSALNGSVNNAFNFWNMVLGTGEQTVNALVGAQVPAGLNLAASLMAGSPTDVVGGGAVGGLLGALDQKLMFDLNVAGLATGATTANPSLQAALTAAIAGTPLQASLGGLLDGSSLQAAIGGLPPSMQVWFGNSPVGLLQQFAQAQIGFNTNLVNGELGFNQSLLTNELGMERQIFGGNSAFNGGVNGVFNAGNQLVNAGEHTINSLLGAQVPTNANLSASLTVDAGG
jgi:hypothetical protein